MKGTTKAKRLWLVIAAMIAMFACALCFVACGNDTTDPSDDNPGIGTPDDNNSPGGEHTSHNYTVTRIVAPTCVERGYTVYTCTCGDSYNDDYIDATGIHTYTRYTYNNNATCVTDGTETATCDVCHAAPNTRTKANTATGIHTYTRYTYNNNATCVADGTETAKCDNCDHTDTRVKVGSARDQHNYNEYVCNDCYSISPDAPITDGLEYTEIRENGSVVAYSVSKGTAGNNKYIKIPATYNDKPVTSIGDFAFSQCSSLTSIEIPDSVTSIGLLAFYDCSSLTSVTIPESVTSIGGSAFANCSSLTSIEIPDSVTSIGERAFSGCSSLTIYCEAVSEPSGWNNIWNNTLTGVSCSVVWDCKNNDKDENGYAYAVIDGIRYSLKAGMATVVIQPSNITVAIIPTSVTYKDEAYGVTSIGIGAFRYCSSLTSITVASGNTKYHSAGNCLIETESKTLIAGCKNSVIPTDGSVTSIGDEAFNGCSSLTSIEIPNSITSIGIGAFRCCGSLTSIEIPNSVTSIGDYAFAACSSLTSIEIPNSVTSIGDEVFRYCGNLTSITVASGNTKYHSAGNCLIETESKTLIAGCNNSVIPTDGSVTSIGNSAFSGCRNLTSIEIPNSVTSIGVWAFVDCSSLTSAAFADPNGWSASSSIDTNSTEIPSEDLSDPSTAAMCLTNIYIYCYWKRS